MLLSSVANFGNQCIEASMAGYSLHELDCPSSNLSRTAAALGSGIALMSSFGQPCYGKIQADPSRLAIRMAGEHAADRMRTVELC